MLALNIISERTKKEIKTKNIYYVVVKILSVLVILISIYAIIFLLATLSIQIKLVQTILENSSLTQNVENYNQQIIKINNKLGVILDIKNDFIEWSYLLEYLSNNISSNITLDRITLDKVGGTMVVNGTSRNRDSLLALKNFLEDSDYFSDVSLPTESLLEKENIDFQITSKIISYEFTKLK